MKKAITSLLALCLALSLTAVPASALELEEAKELLALHYVDGLAPEILEMGSLDEILEAIGDPYTFYMTPEQYEAFNTSVNGQTVVGIGATAETAFNGGYRIMSILPDSPALEAGLQPGDIIVEVDGTQLTAETDPRAYIGGLEGTQVVIAVLREGERLEFTITRRAVSIPIVTYEQRGSAGYIKCTSFGSSTADTFAEAIGEMGDQTAVWIVDLRSNPGGDSNATASAAGYFIGTGTMLYFRDGSGRYQYTYTMPGFPDLTDDPVIVLTSEHSASGSELFAGDMRAYGAGIALGQRTFGKGTAQIVLEESNCSYMVDGEAMKITAYRFFAPDGATNHIVGVLPTLLISPENTEAAALLLSCPAPSSPKNHQKIDLAGPAVYVSLDQALEEENAPAFTELLESLPPSAQVRYSTGKSWQSCDPVAPAALAKELGLKGFVSRTLPDAEGSQYAWEINTLATYGLLSGYDDGLFHPGDSVTRAQFCAMAAAALNLPDGKPGRFPDVKEGSWYAGAVSAMADMGFISGYGDGRFGPDDTISYQEMVAILSKVAAWASMDGYYLNQDPLTLQDALTYSGYAGWAQIPARNLDQLSALLEDASPAAPGSREVSAATLCRLMQSIHLIW